MTEPTNEELVKRLRNLEIGLRNLKFTEAAKDAGQAASRLEALGSGVVVPSADRIALIYFVAHAIKTDFFEGDEIDAEVRAWLEASRNEIPSGMTVEQVVRAMLDARPK